MALTRRRREASLGNRPASKLPGILDGDFAHNLYILAKLQIAQEKASSKAIAQTRERRERRRAA
jgi:hypothetical protein